MQIPIVFPPSLHFGHTVYSHGWCELAPFTATRSPLSLTRILGLPSGRLVRVVMTAGRTPSKPDINVEHSGTLKPADIAVITGQVHAMLNTGIDLRPFHAMVRHDPEFSWVATGRAGRLLRGASMFEDIAKMMLTTNCSWALTEKMNERLIALFGARNTRGWTAFPKPDVIAESSEAVLRSDARLGYRAPFMLEFARRVSCGDFDPEALNDASMPTDDIYAALRSIKGIGNYAASSLLKLLGRYERLGADSWCRARFAELHNNSVPVDDDAIERHYQRFGRYLGLAMWLDVTHHWYHTL